MTIEEALSTMRRYTNWRRGEDLRRFSEVFPECTETPDGEASWILNELAKATARILSMLGQEGPIASCQRCIHGGGKPPASYCQLGQTGECTKCEWRIR